MVLLAQVEFTFSNLTSFLRRFTDFITETSLFPFVRLWADNLPAATMLGYFQAAHYPVRGMEYKPYL